jgi:hypothetical protein
VPAAAAAAWHGANGQSKEMTFLKKKTKKGQQQQQQQQTTDGRYRP